MFFPFFNGDISPGIDISHCTIASISVPMGASVVRYVPFNVDAY